MNNCFAEVKIIKQHLHKTKTPVSHEIIVNDSDCDAQLSMSQCQHKSRLLSNDIQGSFNEEF